MHWLIARDTVLRGMWLRPSRRIYWVTGPAVLEDLGIANNQAKVSQIARLKERFEEDLRSRLVKLKRMEFGQRVRAIQRELGEKANIELQTILSKREYARLKQIDCQAAGPRAMHYAQVVRTLALTRAQRQELTKLARKTSRLVKTLLSAGGTPRPKDDKELNSVFVALKAEHEKQISKILTPPQRKKFARLKGKPVHIPVDVSRFHTPVGGTTVVIDIRTAGLMVTLEARGNSTLVTAATGPHRHEVMTVPGDQRVTVTLFSHRPIRHFSSNDSFTVPKGQTRTVAVSFDNGQVIARVDDDPPMTLSRGLHRQN